MIDEELKNKILTGIQKLAEKWKQEPYFTESRARWLRIGKVTVKKGEEVGCFAVVIMVGKDEKETMQMIDKLIESHHSFFADQKDVLVNEDYTKVQFT